jgi:hypothetical protein
VLLGVGVRALSIMVDDPEIHIQVEQLGDQLLEYAVLLIMIMDASFSIIITAISIRPIAQTLRDAGKVRTKSTGYVDLEKTMYMTLAGSTIAVLSSTILYANLLMFFNGKHEIFSENAFLNPLVLMGNIDSILNSVGMLLVSGIFKYLGPTVSRNLAAATSNKGLSRFSLSISTKRSGKVAAGSSVGHSADSQQHVWNSNAYDEDDSEDGNDTAVVPVGESAAAVPGYCLPAPQHSGSHSKNVQRPSSHFTNTSDKVGTYKNVERTEVGGGGGQTNGPCLSSLQQPSSHFTNVSDKVGTYKNVERPE